MLRMIWYILMATVRRKSSPRVMPVFFSRCLFMMRSVWPYEWFVSSEVVSRSMEVYASQRLMSRVGRFILVCPISSVRV